MPASSPPEPSLPNKGRIGDDVTISASAPRAAAPGTSFVARVAAYVPALAKPTVRLLEQLDPDSQIYIDLQECRWAYGTRVTVRLSATGLQVIPVEQDFIWRGTRNIVDFQIDVPAGATLGSSVVRIELFIAGFRVAFIALSLVVGTKETGALRELATTLSTRTWFASYARRDRRRVLERVAALRIAVRDVEVFMDHLTLRPNDKWKRRLEKEIIACETFLLFWSPHAKRSEYVTWEWKLALEAKGLDSFQVHPLAYADPPPELAGIQMNDMLNDLITAERGLS